MNNRHPWQLKSFEVANLTALAIWPIWPNFEVNGLDWQCCSAGSSKTAPRILIFSIAMDADYSFCVKSIAPFALTFLGYIILVLASVYPSITFRQLHVIWGKYRENDDDMPFSSLKQHVCQRDGTGLG